MKPAPPVNQNWTVLRDITLKDTRRRGKLPLFRGRPIYPLVKQELRRVRKIIQQAAAVLDVLFNFSPV